MYEYFAIHVYLHTTCILDANRSQKNASDTLELELCIVMNCNVSAEI